MTKNKKRILFVSESPWFSTGYSVYTSELLSRLVQKDDLEIAQLAIYASPNDPNFKNYPWKIYGNKPDKNHPNYNAYKNPTAQFGDFSYNQVLLDFLPDIVMDIRDWWMIEYQQRSPFRDFYKWCIMPTVDAMPQNPQWIATYEDADGVLAYSEFGRDVLLSQGDNINFVGIASPAASDNFYMVPDKNEHKNKFGINQNSFIIGTVMRNQKRKLYPDLLKSFRQLLDSTDKNNVFLYCHTYYPDIGWNIPALLDRYSLSNRVLFTYKCKNCHNVSPDFFQDSMQICKKCGKFSNQLVGINNKMSEEDLARIYNIFDVYVQYANSEGFGMPQLEAAYCGLPVISTYYSAMESVIDNLGGIGINPIAYHNEAETGCLRAIPDNDQFVSVLNDLINKPIEEVRQIGTSVMNKARKHYTWDSVAETWLKYINSVEPVDIHTTWLSPSRIKQPQTSIPQGLPMVEQVNFVFNNILCKPEWIGSYFWRRVLRDCTFGYRCDNVDGSFYFNESHIQAYNGYKPFSIEEAAKECLNFRNQINQWEAARQNMIKKLMSK